MSIKVEFLPLCRKGWKKYIPLSLRRRRIKLLENVHQVIDGKTYSAPEGETSDGSSWPLFMPYSPFGSSMEAGIFHDLCYKYRVLFDKYNCPIIINLSRKRCDRIWFKVCTNFDCDGTLWGRFVCATRYIMPIIGYCGLRLFGWWAWHKARSRDLEINLDDFAKILERN